MVEKYWQEKGSIASKVLSPELRKKVKENRRKHEQEHQNVEAWAQEGFQGGAVRKEHHIDDRVEDID